MSGVERLAAEHALSALEYVLEEAIERWHESRTAQTLAEWLGFSDEQYAMYVECRWDDLVASLDALAGAGLADTGGET